MKFLVLFKISSLIKYFYARLFSTYFSPRQKYKPKYKEYTMLISAVFNFLLID